MTSLKDPLKITAIISFLLIIAVLIMQYFFNILPCKMCYFQRYPYYVIILIGALYILLQKHQKILHILVIISLFSSLLLAGYHVGIERKIVSVTPNCATSHNEFTDKDSLLIYLKQQKAVACDVAAFKLLLTLSEWNLVIATLLLFYNLFILYQKPTNVYAKKN